jgi:Fe-S cluster assembly protein SufD
LFKLHQFGWVAESDTTDSVPKALLAEDVDLAGKSISWNGRPREDRLEGKWSRRGVLFGSLEQLIVEHGETIRPFLMTRGVDPDYDKFSALHAAFWSAGTVLYVPRGVVIDQPLYSLAAMAEGASDLSHVLVILEDGAEATLLCETASSHEHATGFHCGACELIVGQGASLRFVNLQNWGQGVWHFAHQKAVLAQDAALQWTMAAMGSKVAKVNQHVELAGAGSSCQVNGVLFTQDKQHLSYHTLQHHVLPQRFPLQVGAAGQISHRLARNDQSRKGSAANGRLPAKRQSAPLQGSTRGLHSRIGNRSR